MNLRLLGDVASNVSRLDVIHNLQEQLAEKKAEINLLKAENDAKQQKIVALTIASNQHVVKILVKFVNGYYLADAYYAHGRFHIIRYYDGQHGHSLRASEAIVLRTEHTPDAVKNSGAAVIELSDTLFQYSEFSIWDGPVKWDELGVKCVGCEHCGRWFEIKRTSRLATVTQHIENCNQPKAVCNKPTAVCNRPKAVKPKPGWEKVPHDRYKLCYAKGPNGTICLKPEYHIKECDFQIDMNEPIATRSGASKRSRESS